MQVRDSSGTKTKEKVSLIFPLRRRLTSYGAWEWPIRRHETWNNGHETRNRGRKKVKGKLVWRTIPGRRKSAWQPQDERNTEQLLCSATLSRRNSRTEMRSEDNRKTLEKDVRSREKDSWIKMVYQWWGMQLAVETVAKRGRKKSRGHQQSWRQKKWCWWGEERDKEV